MTDLQNRVLRIECVNEGDFWVVHITRQCQEKDGLQTLTEKAVSMFAALDQARSMVSEPYEARPSISW